MLTGRLSPPFLIEPFGDTLLSRGDIYGILILLKKIRLDVYEGYSSISKEGTFYSFW